MFRLVKVRFGCFHRVPCHEMRVWQFVTAFVDITSDGSTRFGLEFMSEKNGVWYFHHERPLIVGFVRVLVVELYRGVTENIAIQSAGYGSSFLPAGAEGSQYRADSVELDVVISRAFFWLYEKFDA